MVDSSMPLRDQNRQITFPSLQYMTEITGFAPDFDYVRAYEIPPAITSIEWLNRQSYCNNMTFAVANDKKIRLFKLRKSYMDMYHQ